MISIQDINNIPFFPIDFHLTCNLTGEGSCLFAVSKNFNMSSICSKLANGLYDCGSTMAEFSIFTGEFLISACDLLE